MAVKEKRGLGIGLEALFGWLYLQGKTERIAALFSFITEDAERNGTEC